jgi:hypothetical protein
MSKTTPLQPDCCMHALHLVPSQQAAPDDDRLPVSFQLAMALGWHVHFLCLQERPSGMYNLSAYYLARTAADFPAELVNVVLFVVISYWFGGLRHTAGAFFGLLFSLVLVTFTAESWGLLVGGVFMEPKTAQVG